jgi:hypothetical protein
MYNKEWCANHWEVFNNCFGADSGTNEEMAVDDLLGHVGNSVPSPSPSFSPDWSSGRQDIYQHCVKGVMALYKACAHSKSSPTVTKVGMAPSAVPNNRSMVITRR